MNGWMSVQVNLWVGEWGEDWWLDRTGAGCYDSSGKLLFAQTTECMVRPPYFEGADTLEVLAFEEEIYFGSSWPLALEGCADEGFGRLWSRCEFRECSRGHYRCEMNMFSDKLVGALNRFARQRERFGDVCHVVRPSASSSFPALKQSIHADALR